MVLINTNAILLIYSALITAAIGCEYDVNYNGSSSGVGRLTRLERQLKEFVDETLSRHTYNIMEGVRIERSPGSANPQCHGDVTAASTFDDYVQKRLQSYARTHVISVKVPHTARFLNIATGKSSFLTGFGLGFLAFGLKKLLLPVFIAAQIVKSVLIAMFLPSILGSLGKLVGKGISHASSLSGSSGHQAAPIEDFDFKDTGTPYNTDGATNDEYAAAAEPSDYNFNSVTTTAATVAQQAMNRYSTNYQRVSYVQPQSDSYYLRQPTKQLDYKVFHKIPNSSMLLTTYDPFYSPLLSRLDSVFQQLGLGAGKGADMEKCRERLVCMMYANPAKYAPYSNLISAQLSRELNELRKPSSDNPEILRFFRYMKAAKDGQDGEECMAHGGCPSLQADRPSPAMLTTFNDINKLVQARLLH